MKTVERLQLVSYNHPSWGKVTGVVLDATPHRRTCLPCPNSGACRAKNACELAAAGDPNHTSMTEEVLVQDLSANGAREYWPLARLESVVPGEVVDEKLRIWP